MKRNLALRYVGVFGFAGLLIVIGATAQSVVNTVIFNPPGVTNNVGFDSEAAVVRNTGLVYVGATGAYGNEVGVINPTTNAIVAAVPLSQAALYNFACVNQTTNLVYFRQPTSNIELIQ